MQKNCPSSDEVRWLAVRKRSQSSSYISIARDLNKHRTTISRWYNYFLLTGDVHSPSEISNKLIKKKKNYKSMLDGAIGNMLITNSKLHPQNYLYEHQRM